MSDGLVYPLFLCANMHTLLAAAALLLAANRPAFPQETTRGWTAGAGLGAGATALDTRDSEGGTKTTDPGMGVAVRGGYFVKPRLALVGNLNLAGFERGGNPSLTLVVGPGALFRITGDVQLLGSIGYAMAGYQMPTVPSYFHRDSGAGESLALAWLPLRFGRQAVGLSGELAGAAVSGRTFVSGLVAVDWQYR